MTSCDFAHSLRGFFNVVCTKLIRLVVGVPLFGKMPLFKEKILFSFMEKIRAGMSCVRLLSNQCVVVTVPLLSV